MHLLVLIQEQFPQGMFANVETRRSREIQRFLDFICKKNYSATHLTEEWNKMRPREIKLFDFTIPEKIEKEVIQDLMDFEGGSIGNKMKGAMENRWVQKIVKKFFGVIPINRTGLVATKNIHRIEYPVYISIIGKFLDQHDKNGMEMI